MKTNMFIFVLSAFCLFNAQVSNAQNGVNVITIDETPAEIYAGSLHHTTSDVYQKLKIEVFGGSFLNENLGVTTYYISSRNGILINMERHGGDGNNFNLKVYKRDWDYDFVIARTTDTYCSFTVQSQQLHGGNWGISPMIPVAVAAYNSTGKTDVTDQFPVNIIFATNNNGNIGIGTDCARSKLDVNGTLRATEVKVELANWSDFVFAPDYELPSLKDVEAHILDKQHLPGIPSEKEVVENGIDLGQMNALLLQKIEELTLHLINQEKRISTLETEKRNQPSNSIHHVNNQ